MPTPPSTNASAANATNENVVDPGEETDSDTTVFVDFTSVGGTSGFEL